MGDHLKNLASLLEPGVATVTVLSAISALIAVLAAVKELVKPTPYRRIIAWVVVGLAVLVLLLNLSAYVPMPYHLFEALLFIAATVCLAVMIFYRAKVTKYEDAAAILNGICNQVLYANRLYPPIQEFANPGWSTNQRAIANLLRDILKQSLQIVSTFCFRKPVQAHASVMLYNREAASTEDRYLYIYVHHGLQTETEELFQLHPHRAPRGIGGRAFVTVKPTSGGKGDLDYVQNDHSEHDEREIETIFSIPLTYKRFRSGGSSKYVVIGVLSYTTNAETKWESVDEHLLFTVAHVITMVIVADHKLRGAPLHYLEVDVNQ